MINLDRDAGETVSKYRDSGNAWVLCEEEGPDARFRHKESRVARNDAEVASLHRGRRDGRERLVCAIHYNPRYAHGCLPQPIHEHAEQKEEEEREDDEAAAAAQPPPRRESRTMRGGPLATLRRR